MALNGFVPFYFSMFSMDYRLFHSQKKIVFFAPFCSHPHFYWGFCMSALALFPEGNSGLLFSMACASFVAHTLELAVSTRPELAFLLGILDASPGFVPRRPKGWRDRARGGIGMHSSQPRPIASDVSMKKYLPELCLLEIYYHMINKMSMTIWVVSQFAVAALYERRKPLKIQVRRS